MVSRLMVSTLPYWYGVFRDWKHKYDYKFIYVSCKYLHKKKKIQKTNTLQET